MFYFSRKSQVFKSCVKYTFFGTVQSLLGILISVLMLRWLIPEEIGKWNAIYVITFYTPIIHLGIQSALNLDLPILLGRGEETKSKQYVATAKYISVVSACLFLLVSSFLLIVYVQRNDIDDQKIAGFISVIGIVTCSLYRLHLIATFRASKFFDKLSVMMAVQCLIDIVLMYFIYRYRYYGLVVYYFINELFQTLFMHICAPYRKLPMSFHKSVFKALFIRGIFQLGSVQLKLVLESAPRLIILYIAGTTYLGLFAPALSIQGVCSILPTHIGSYILPQIGHKFGLSNSRAEVWKSVKKILLIFPLIGLPFSTFLYFVLPPLISCYFPKYVESITSMTITSIAFIFSGSSFVINILVMLKEYKATYLYYILSLFYMIIAVVSLSYFIPNKPLEIVSFSILIQQFLSYITSIVITHNRILK